ncbi:unnamed protein product [Leuciscus chuanchicus]
MPQRASICPTPQVANQGPQPYWNISAICLCSGIIHKDRSQDCERPSCLNPKNVCGPYPKPLCHLTFQCQRPDDVVRSKTGSLAYDDSASDRRLSARQEAFFPQASLSSTRLHDSLLHLARCHGRSISRHSDTPRCLPGADDITAGTQAHFSGVESVLLCR